MSRELFEKLPEIAANLHNVVFDNGSNEYLPKKMGYVIHEFSAYYLNGAWMMYQEQQSKVEDVLQQLDTLQGQYWSKWKEKADMMDQGASVAYEHSYWMLKEVLR